MIAAIDYGTRRVGLAIADPASDSAFHLETLLRNRLGPELELLRQRFCQYEVTRVIIGLPLNMDGSRGRQAEMVEAFAAQVRSLVAIPVEFQDERLTSFEAQARLKSLPMTRRKRKVSVDALAAAIILEDWLASQRKLHR
jgi:putative Holliday junction resolvase